MLVHFANAGFIAKPTNGGDAPRDKLAYLHHATIASSFVAVASPRRECRDALFAYAAAKRMLASCTGKRASAAF